MTKRDALIAVCTLARTAGAGTCAWCGTELPPRRRSWCSDRCGDAFWANHWWSVARRTAKRRDRYRCKRCGAAPPKRPARAAFASHAKYLAAMRAWRKAKRTTRLEVNHIVPCRGKHATLDCAHHLDNLETLCPPCHKTHTSALRPPASPRSAGAPQSGAVAGDGVRRACSYTAGPPSSARRGVSAG